MRNYLKTHKRILFMLYAPFHFAYYIFLNHINVNNFHPIESTLDARIPFHELFAVPYYIWYVYIVIGVLYFYFTSREDYLRLVAYMFGGMLISLIVYTIYPTGIFFRPEIRDLPRDNFFTDMVKAIYRIDQPTNVCPSLHCFNAICVTVVIFKSKRFNNRTWLKAGTAILTVLICLSTMFIKQHSIIDFFWAVVLAAVLYVPAFFLAGLMTCGRERKAVHSVQHAGEESRPEISL